MTEDYNVIINKGNYSLETKKREDLFENYRSEGWKKEYDLYRKNWSQYPKKQYISDYPLLVDIELASVCNLKCPMCYTITPEFKKNIKPKLMDFTLFTKIIDEISDKVPAVRLSLRGESLLHKKFIDCIRYAKGKGIKEVSFLTNGSKLNEEYFEEILLSGADWITISIDGLNETYDKIRRPLKFDDLIKKIKDIKKIKESFRTNRPVIKIQSIWPAIRDNPEEYYNTFVNLVDYIAFNPQIDFTSKSKEKVFLDNFLCPQLYQRLVITADGQALMCANDEDNQHIIGNANKEKIHTIWHSDKLNTVRDLHKRKQGFMQIQVCKECYLPVATDKTEKAIVNDREIIIKNYIYK